MRSNKHAPTPASKQSSWRPFVDFLVRRRTRILFTIILALAVDAAGGWLLQHNLAEVDDPKAFLGLAAVLTGFTLLAWSIGSRGNRPHLAGAGVYSLIEKPIYAGLFASLLGLCLLVDDPKNIWLLLAPVILLDLLRIAREDCTTSLPFALQRARNARIGARTASRRSYPSGWRLRFGRIAPILTVPIVTLAVIAYASPLVSLQFHEVCEIFCLLLSLFGLAIRMLVAGYMPDRSPGRDDPRQSSTRLNTHGVFSIFRRPRLLGDYCIGLGVVMIPFVWWLPLSYTLAFWLYCKRITTVDEEELRRKSGQRSVHWASAPTTMVPRQSRWRLENSRFSFRTAVKREHAGLILVIALHSSVEWLEHLVLERRIMLELFWIVLAFVGLSVFVAVRLLDRHTRLLNVPAA
jgi:protein-S-isoprenylcysteine O-methyltransferase Ste14